MFSSVLCLTVVALGIESGWQPLPDGGLEYLIQIEPHLLERLREGHQIASDLDPSAKGVRSVRVLVGTHDLPRRALPEPAGNSLALPESSILLQSGGPLLGAPGPLSPARDSRPIGERQASFQQEVPQAPEPAASPSDTEVAVATVPPLKWTVTVGALVASLGGMLYLGWVAWDYRRRYHRLLDRLFEGGHRPLVGEEY